MRILGLLKADEDSEAGAPPSKELIERMGSFIEEITKAGVMLATDGLQPSSKGTRVKLSDGKVTVTDGPFAEAKEVIGAYWIIQVRSREEAIEWAKRAPMSDNEVIEVRQIHEMPDFPQDVQKAPEGFERPNAAVK